MKNIYKLLSTLTLSILLSSVQAASLKSCPVNILGGIVNPGDKIILRIDHLPRNATQVYYNLSCKIINNYYNDTNSPVIKSWTSGNEQILVNGRPLNVGQAGLPKNINTFEVRNIAVTKQSNGVIVASETTILNLDDCRPITVDGCQASLAQ